MYQPVLITGEKPVFPWQLVFLKIFALWPLCDNVSKIIEFFRNVWSIIIILSYSLTVYGELLFIFENINNLTLFTECLCTNVIGFACLLRHIYVCVKLPSFKLLLEKFYRDIYVSEK